MAYLLDADVFIRAKNRVTVNPELLRLKGERASVAESPRGV